jgi:hypothetical protein
MVFGTTVLINKRDFIPSIEEQVNNRKYAVNTIKDLVTSSAAPIKA